MLEVIGAIVVAVLVAALAVTGIAVGTLAGIAVVLVVIGIVCTLFGIAIIFVVKVAAAILIAAVLQKLLYTCLTRIGESFRIPALRNAGTVGKITFILSWASAVYLCFVKC